MGWNWHNYEHEWQRRRKNADEKRIWRDVSLTKDNEGTFHLNYHPQVYVRNPKNKWVTQRGKAQKLATITADNVLTLLYADRPNMTICNRLTDIIGRTVWSDKTYHRNKESSVRIRTVSRQVPDPWHPTGVDPHNWVHANIPYKEGIMFRLDVASGDPRELLTPIQDVAVLVKNEAIQQVKADTKILRVLLRSMARIGVFDEAVVERLDSYRSYAPVDDLLGSINYKDPSGEDAQKVVHAGLTSVNTPQLSGYVNGVWVKRSPEERIKELRERAIESGMKQLRSYIYKTTDGYERLVR